MKTKKKLIYAISTILVLAGAYLWINNEKTLSIVCFVIITILGSFIHTFDGKIIKNLEKTNKELADKLKNYEELEQNN